MQFDADAVLLGAWIVVFALIFGAVFRNGGRC